MGPLGSGKTFGMYDRLLQTMCEQAPNAQGVRPSRWVAIRNTYSQLETTTIKDFRALFTDQIGTMVMGNQPSYRTRVLLEDGTRLDAEVIFLALDREDAVAKLRGFQLTGGVVNETKELVKAIIDMLDLRVGRFPSMADGGVQPTWHGIIGDTNAPDTDHWYYRLAEEQRPEGWKFFRQPGGVIRSGGGWVANPKAENLRNLPAGYYATGMQGKSEDWISVNLGNEYGFSLDGKPVHFRTPIEARQSGIEAVYQTLAVAPALDIATNMYLGREVRRKGPLGSVFRMLDSTRMRTQAKEHMTSLGIGTLQNMGQAVETLSGGQRQAVAVARAAAFGTKVIILDEPTAALGVRESGQVLRLIESLRDRGLPVILISHNMPQVFEVADRIHVHRLGKRAAVVTPSTVKITDVVAIMTGALVVDEKDQVFGPVR